jgi:hypothetical protein
MDCSRDLDRPQVVQRIHVLVAQLDAEMEAGRGTGVSFGRRAEIAALANALTGRDADLREDRVCGLERESVIMSLVKMGSPGRLRDHA